MRTTSCPRAVWIVLLAGPLCCGRGAAQGLLQPGQLSPRTSFYVMWHGTPAGEARKSNSVYALWDDPEFAAARTSLFESVLKNKEKATDKPAASQEEMAQYATLLDNAFIVGYLRRPEAYVAQKSADSKDAKPPEWNGMYFIYDRSGREELFSKAVLQMRGSEKEIPKLMPMTLAGVPALKVEDKNGVRYWAEFGKYAVNAGEPSVFEEVVNRLNGKMDGGALAQSAVFQEAQPLLNGGVMEFYLDISSAQGMASETNSQFATLLKQILTALKVETMHSVVGRVSIEGAKTHIQGALLGDTAGGGLFDIWPDGQTKPASLSYLSADTVYYSEFQINLLGIYGLVKSAFTPKGATGAQNANPLQTAAEARIGMPLPDALGLVTGEFARLQTSPMLDQTQQVYLIGIRDKENALKLARTLMGDRITSERNEGKVTYLKISLQGGQTSKGVAQWNFYHLAMTPSMLLGASKSETLRRYVEMTPAGGDPALPKPIAAARGQFPEKLDGFSYFDFEKLDWAGLRTKWVEEENKSAETAKSTDAADHSKKLADWLSQVNPEVFSRHLHTVSGASWKDAKGVHFEEWVE